MNFTDTIKNEAEEKYSQLLFDRLPAPFKVLRIDSYDEYRIKNSDYHNRLIVELNKFNNALQTVNRHRAERVQREEAIAEEKARRKFKISQIIKALTFLLPTILCAIMGWDLFNPAKDNINQLSGSIGISSTWVILIFAAVCFFALILTVSLIVQMHRNETYINRRNIVNKTRYTIYAIIVAILTSSIVGYNLYHVISKAFNVYHGEGYAFSYKKTVDGYCLTECTITSENLDVEIVIPDWITDIKENAFSYSEEIVGITMPNISLKAEEEGTEKSILDYIFDKVPSSLKEISIINGTSINASAFLNCESLVQIKLSDSIRHIGDSAFSGCNSLKSCFLPNGLLSIGKEAFYHCSNLDNIVIPESITSIGDRAFSYCTGLNEIYFNAAKCNDFKEDSNVFANSGAETGISIKIGTEVERVPSYLFTNTYKTWNRNFESIYRSAYQQYVGSILAGAMAFGGSANYMSFEQWVMKNHSYLVYGSCGLNHVEFLPKGKCTAIGARAFYNTHVDEISIPPTITTIEVNAFGGCESLAFAEFQGESSTWEVSNNSDFSTYERIDATDSSINASYLSQEYCKYYWRRSDV